ncbi:proton channel OTOP3-like [Electrophorus electricus]|uniref:proton channel OTOP3-like n=1 Tax=Electrophorus electricus TaxID=8005 RepID=UPI0015D0BBD6|nr:proton channel OTOP3-like [Electrophorus electricus]
MEVECGGLESVEVEKVEAKVSDQEVGHAPQWVPIGRRLISGLLGLNVVLLGAALVAEEAFTPLWLQQQEPEVFVMVLMGLSLVWMVWYLLWGQKQPGPPPHTDHHAGSATIKAVLMLFAVLSLLLCVFSMGYYLLLRECQPLSKVVSPFMQAPFFILQTYLLWAHSKDCIHKHKVLTRCGLMVTLCADGLLWLCAVTADSIHMVIELEWQGEDCSNITLSLPAPGGWNGLGCCCYGDTLCASFQKGYEILYPFNMEFTLLAACMLYVMWKNVGRHTSSVHTEHVQETLLRSVWREGVQYSSLVGLLVLLSGVTMFVLYHMWIDQKAKRLQALMLFYSFHLGLLPIMALSSLIGTLVQKQKGKEREHGGSKNPTQSLDVTLLLGTAIGQLGLSYLTLVASLALGPSGILGSLDLSYSLLSLVELVLQNVFIVKALHLHTQLHIKPHRLVHSDGYLRTHSSLKAKEDQEENLQAEKKVDEAQKHELEGKNDTSMTPTGRGKYSTNHLKRRVTKEICAFLILSNITLWVISAFGAHPELKSGMGKQFFGYSVWFVLVNLSQPLTVFYRMHSVGALMELLISA